MFNLKTTSKHQFFNILNTALIAVFLLCLVFSSTSYAQSSNEEEGFNANYTIEKLEKDFKFTKKGISVKEKFSVKFLIEQHGLKRTIPLIYEYHSSDGKINQISRLEVSVKSITDDKGNKIPFETSINRDSLFNTADIISGLFYDVLVVKIGDPDKLVKGNTVYNIEYEITNLPENPSPFLYDITLTGASTKINNYYATLHFETPPSNISCIYALARTEQKNTCKVEKIDDNTYQVSRTLVEFKYGIAVNIEGLSFNHQNADFIVFMQRYWYLLIPPLLLLLLILYWALTQRPPKGTGIITPQFTLQNDLKPAEMGTIYDDSVDKIDVSATIIDLAVRGYIHIRNVSENEKKPEFELILQKPIDTGVQPFETLLINGIFQGNNAILVKDLSSQSMVGVYEKIQQNLYLWGVKEGYFRSKPDKANSFLYAAIFAGLCAGPAAIFNLLSIPVSVGIAIICLIPAIPIFYFRNYKREKGVLIKEKIEGLKLFIEYAKKDQLELLQTPYSKQEMFEKYLPYAMIFGLHKSWAEVFKNFNIDSPSWYEGGYGNNLWDIIFFTHYMNLFSNSLNTAFSIPISDTGAGFIGGVVGNAVGGGLSGGGVDSW